MIPNPYKLHILTITLFLLCSCHNKTEIVGHWKPIKVKIWDSHRRSLEIDGRTKYFPYDHDNPVFRSELATKQYQDSILQLLQISYLISYLIIKSDSTFQFEDHGFFNQAITDSAWHGKKTGTWSLDLKKSIITLRQSMQLSKNYKIRYNSIQSITLGELYPGNSNPITETTLTR
jgi:hypothetical protein